MSAIVPENPDRIQALTRMKCGRIAFMEMVKGYGDKKIASLLRMSEGQLALFRNRNALIMDQFHDRFAKSVAERTASGKLALRIGAASRAHNVLESWDEAFASDNLVVKARVAETVANRIDPIKNITEVSVTELSQKTIQILSRGADDMGELVADAEFIEGDTDANES